ncbi:MAG: hypothetical protein GX273_08415 [Bacteroidales bacterium]|nr:hypothetical protein [Bacteroidales bacterium]
MEASKFIIKRIEGTVNSDLSSYRIGLRGFPQSQVLLETNNETIVFAENCDNRKLAKEVYDYFIEKGMLSDTNYGLNSAVGIFIVENK